MSTLEILGWFFLALGTINVAVFGWLLHVHLSERRAERRHDDAARYQAMEVSP